MDKKKSKKKTEQPRIAAGLDATQIIKAVIANDRIMREAMRSYNEKREK